MAGDRVMTAEEERRTLRRLRCLVPICGDRELDVLNALRRDRWERDRRVPRTVAAMLPVAAVRDIDGWRHAV